MNEFNSALSKAMRFCSTKEVCIKDITFKLNNWNTNPEFIDKIIASLIDEKFIDQQRYALAFAADKFKFNNWGKKKIAFHLINKNIPKNIIQKALNDINDTEYKKTAQKLINNKLKNLKTNDKIKLKNKILSSMTSKGYEPDIIYPILNEILK
ncbi:MAG: RecX family transcriptional regulator [Bacteroidales bacterium]|nr:RecX family transcriptional regulator [Bacteroidales bacterium]